VSEQTNKKERKLKMEKCCLERRKFRVVVVVVVMCIVVKNFKERVNKNIFYVDFIPKCFER
jgi:hypothetical protein